MSKNKKQGFLIAVLTAILAIGVASVAHAACELKLGMIGPLSGPAAQWGLSVKAAADFVAAESNQAGGIQVGNEKCKVSVDAVDSKYTPEGAAAAANHMVTQGVRFIIGPVVTPEINAVKPIANRNGILLMADSYARDAIGPQWPLVFHAMPGPATWANDIIRFAKNKFGFKKVVMIVPNDQGGTDIAAVTVPAYKNNGIEAVEEYYNRGITNFAPLVARIMNAKADAVDTGGSSPGDGGVIVKQLRLAGFEGVIGRLGGPGSAEIARIAGGYEAMKNAYWFESVFIDEKIRVIASEYKKMLNAEPPENSIFYAFVPPARMVLKAIAKAGTMTDTKKVAEVLRTLPIDDPNFGKGYWVGQGSFGINQEMSMPYGIGLVVSGKLQPMVRAEAATGK